MATDFNSSLRHLRAFQMVAKLRNVRRAAETVHLTQPAVTLAIAKLECQAEAVLFDRRSRGTYLTSAGELLASRVDRMFDQIEEALQWAGVEPGTMELGLIAERITRAQVRALVAIAGHPVADLSEGGISKASIHRAARELEKNLGVRLVRPGVEGLTTTEIGSELARRLTIALREVNSGIEEIAAENDRWHGQLRVGAMPLSGSFVVCPVLTELMEYYPEAQFEVRTGDGSQLTRAILRGEIDLIVGLLRCSTGAENIEQERLVKLPYVLVARRNHPLAKKDRLTLSDLEGYDWVAPNERTARRGAFNQIIKEMRKPPTANIVASSLSTVRLLLSGSDRLALLTRFEFEQEKSAGELIDLRFGPIEPAHSLGIRWRSNWVPTPLHKKFMELVRRRALEIAASDPHAELVGKQAQAARDASEVA